MTTLVSDNVQHCLLKCKTSCLQKTQSRPNNSLLVKMQSKHDLNHKQLSEPVLQRHNCRFLTTFIYITLQKINFENNLILSTGLMMKLTRGVIHSTTAVPGRDSSFPHQTEKMVIYSSSSGFKSKCGIEIKFLWLAI